MRQLGRKSNAGAEHRGLQLLEAARFACSPAKHSQAGTKWSFARSISPLTASSKFSRSAAASGKRRACDRTVPCPPRRSRPGPGRRASTPGARRGVAGRRSGERRPPRHRPAGQRSSRTPPPARPGRCATRPGGGHHQPGAPRTCACARAPRTPPAEARTGRATRPPPRSDSDGSGSVSVRGLRLRVTVPTGTQGLRPPTEFEEMYYR